MLLSDKICIITGAASPRGIGRATARLFAAQGARVVILDLDEGQAREAAADLGQGHLGLACNVTDKQACLNAAERTIGDYGRVDVLINNAGISQSLRGGFQNWRARRFATRTMQALCSSDWMMNPSRS